MDSFLMEIAKVVFEVSPLFETTALYCREYLTDREPEYRVTVDREDLIREQELLDQEADEEGLKRRKFPEPFLERSVIQRKVAEFLLERDTLMLHGSTVAVDGQAYLFTAGCGTGKSTHTRRWREVFGERAVMVNDDKPFLRIGADGVTAYGTPWSGKHGLDTNIAVSLRGICFLRRGTENRIAGIGPEQARAMLRHQCFLPEEDEARVFPMVERLMELVPLWEMECTKERQAAQVASAAMCGGNWDVSEDSK